MSHNKTGPVFFLTASETEELSGFWGGGRALFLLTSTWRSSLKRTPLVLRATAAPGWMEGRVDA